MDSFYDAPRRAPVPSSLTRLAPTPMVPEVSILCNNKPTTPHTYSSYNSWKATNPVPRSNKENSGINTSQCMKKQVRFESPTLQAPPEPFSINRQQNQAEAHTTNPYDNLKGKTFEQIYLANVPNRRLDLSHIDLSAIPNNSTAEVVEKPEGKKELPKTYKEFVSTKPPAKPNDSITDILNYKRPTSSNKPNEKLQLAKEKILQNEQVFHKYSDNYVPILSGLKQAKSDGGTQTSAILKPDCESEPSVKDLLKIISQQNEQLILLQKQVATLINRDQQQLKQIEPAPATNYVTSTHHENFRNGREVVTTPRKRANPLSKFSIDLMTSFEVSFRPQQQQQHNYEPKITEISETTTESDRRSVDASMHFAEPLRVVESCPSPEPSVQIDMNDFDSSEEDDVSASDIRASFYRNLMGQVNNILKRAQLQPVEDVQTVPNKEQAKVCDKTMHRVKEATLKHLKSIGVSMPDNDVSDESVGSSNDSKDYSPTEISFAVKQLLMKYLPPQHLAKVAHKKSKENVKTNGLIASRPEFSFASVQYMKKYNLLNNDGATTPSNQRTDQPPVSSPKILDITKLKNQPKLL